MNLEFKKGKNLMEEKTNLIGFEEARKKLQGGDPPLGENWLKNLSEGTVFSAKQKHPPNHPDYHNPFVDTYRVLWKGEITTKILISTGMQSVEKWVETLAFSRTFLHLETYGVFEDDVNVEEQPDGSGE